MLDESKEFPIWVIAVSVLLAGIMYYFMENDTDGTCVPKVTKERNCINIDIGQGNLQHVCFDMGKK